MAAFTPRPRFPPPPPVPPTQESQLDRQLNTLITVNGLTGEVHTHGTTTIDDPLAQLGMKLFFTKALGGESSVACASCHHPALGGADALSLAIGVDTEQEDVVGRGRRHVDGLAKVPRNSPTIFNSGLSPNALFWDGRIERIRTVDQNGEAKVGISTPDSGFGVIDEAVPNNLLNALSRFPVTSKEEMRGTGFENAQTNQAIRSHIAAKIGGYASEEAPLATNDWLTQFRQAFGNNRPAEDLITFDSIAMALGRYQQSLNFVDTHWHRYVRGDKSALTQAQKRGAVLFFTQPNQGGAGCVTCHSGERFTNDGFFNLAFPQIGPGKTAQGQDLGRATITQNVQDNFAFRVPSLINVALTAPYGHSGVFDHLSQVVRHYVNPRRSVDDYFARGGACFLVQFRRDENCNDLNEGAIESTHQALRLLAQTPFQPVRLSPSEIDELVEFLNALTDVCASSRDCIDKYIPSQQQTDPDNLRLNATDARGNSL
ncbi:Di-haem cytochrome c peroxidase [Pseudoalteromonas luteoviolacea B = ATCC 29581]|nr:Di-haem cytochrome c peroxidase [Pseudoalteromonas luteoviolacea B = ATCC 29581]